MEHRARRHRAAGPGTHQLQKHQFGVGLALGEIRRAGQLPANVRLLLAGRRYGRVYGALLDPWLEVQGVTIGSRTSGR